MNDEEWKTAEKHLNDAKKTYLEFAHSLPGVNVNFALRMVIYPLENRYNSGERTKKLYDEMMAME